MRTVPSHFGPRGSYRIADRVILIVRECANNAISYGATQCHCIPMMIDGVPWLVVAHDGRPFGDLEEIGELGCTPNQSGRRGNSLNGEGLCQAAGLASHPDIELVVASRFGDTIGAMRGRADFRGLSSWVVDDQSDKWSDIIRSRLGDWARLKRMNVFYAFKMEGRPAESPFGAKHMNELIWMCGPIMGRVEGDGKLAIFVCERFLEENETYGKVSAGGGSRRRPVVPLSEYNDRFQGGEFHVPAAPVRLKIGQEEYRVHGGITLRSYPVEMKSSGSYFASIRDGVSAAGVPFPEGSTASSNGCRPGHSVYAYFPCLADAPAFSRFADDAQWKARDPGSFLYEMDLPYYEGTTKFVVAEIRVTGIDRVHGRVESMRVASALGRGGDFMFTDARAVREMCLELCRHADRASEGWRAAEEHLRKVFPPRERELMGFRIRWTFPTRSSRFDIYDADTGEPFSKEALSGSAARLALWDTEGGGWVAPSEVQVPATFGHSVDLGLPESEPPGLEELAESVAPDPRVVAVRVAGMARRDGDEDWTPCGPRDYEHTAEFRPKRKIRLTVRGDVVNICTVVDVPPRPRGGPQPPTRDGPGPRGTLYPYCDRHEFFLASLPRNSDFVLFCQAHPFTRRYFLVENDPRLYDAVWTLYKSLNVASLKLLDSLAGSEPRELPEELLPPEEAGPYGDDGIDFALNTLLKGMIADDPLVLAAMKKVDDLRLKVARDAKGG